MTTKRQIRVGVRELRKDLTRYLKEAGEGTSVLVTSRNAVIAELHEAPPEILPPRRPGRLKGKIWMADDFDTWPEGFLDEMEDWKH